MKEQGAGRYYIVICQYLSSLGSSTFYCGAGTRDRAKKRNGATDGKNNRDGVTVAVIRSDQDSAWLFDFDRPDQRIQDVQVGDVIADGLPVQQGDAIGQVDPVILQRVHQLTNDDGFGRQFGVGHRQDGGEIVFTVAGETLEGVDQLVIVDRGHPLGQLGEEAHAATALEIQELELGVHCLRLLEQRQEGQLGIGLMCLQQDLHVCGHLCHVFVGCSQVSDGEDEDLRLALMIRDGVALQGQDAVFGSGFPEWSAGVRYAWHGFEAELLSQRGGVHRNFACRNSRRLGRRLDGGGGRLGGQRCRGGEGRPTGGQQQD